MPDGAANGCANPRTTSVTPVVRPSRAGPLPAGLTPLARVGELLYGSGVSIRNWSFDAKVRGNHSLGLPTISIGNIAAGGSGKSPFTRALAQIASAAGKRPCILLRGYGASAGEQSDEEMEHRSQMSDVPVIADASRRRASLRALALPSPPDAFLLDDGFQHRQVRRDLDIVLIDASEPWLRGARPALLPCGWLREHPRSLARADAVVITRSVGFDAEIAASVKRWHGNDPVAWCQHRWSSLFLHSGQGAATGQSRQVETQWLQGQPVLVVAAIAQPSRFTDQVRQAGANVVGSIEARDHAALSHGMIESILFQAKALGAAAIVCTGKDWVKVSRVIDGANFDRQAAEQVPWCVPQLEMQFWKGQEALRDLVTSALRS